MGWTFTWFLTSETEFGSALHGWKKPSSPTAEPKSKTAKNPFTGKAIVIWEYQSSAIPDAEPDAVMPSYKNLPHFTSKMDLWEVGRLLHLLTGRDADQLSSLLLHLKLKGPDDLESTVHHVPQDLVVTLAGAPNDLRTLAQRWTALQPAPESWEGNEVDGRERWLNQLISLARIAVSTNREMFVHWNI